MKVQISRDRQGVYKIRHVHEKDDAKGVLELGPEDARTAPFLEGLSHKDRDDLRQGWIIVSNLIPKQIETLKGTLI